MIVYAMACPCGTAFEGWFRSSGDCDDQVGHGLVECPSCGCAGVSKAPMAPAVTRSGSRDGRAGEPPEGRTRPRYVGDAFAAEVRAMAGGRKPHERIVGQATPRESEALLAEGIAIRPADPGDVVN